MTKNDLPLIQEQSLAVLVLGMHRSGTSALAGMLNFAGLDLGGNLTPGRADNPKGYFEHDEIWQIHEQLMKEIGSNWNDIRSFPPRWREMSAVTLAIGQLSAVLHRDFTDKPLWGVKDPRLSRFFCLWPELLAGLVAEPRVILAIRHPMEVAASLRQRDGLTTAHGLALWLRYTLDAERSTRGFRRAVQPYSHLLDDWRAEFSRLRAALALPLPEPTSKVATLIDEFLDSNLRHHHVADAWGDQPQPLIDWCTQAYAAMLNLPDAGSLRIFDMIGEAVTVSEAQALGYSAQITNHLIEIRRQQDKNHWLESERVANIAASNDAAAKLVQLASELERAQEDIRQRNDSIKNAHVACSEVRDELEKLKRSRSWRLTQPLRALLWRIRQLTLYPP